MGNTFTRLACCAFAVVFSFAAAGEEELQVEPIAEEHYPALVFVQEGLTGDPRARDTLMVATFVGDKPTVRKVITSQSVTAVQLADSVFRVGAYWSPEDRSQWTASHFLVDFQTGSHVLLSETKSRDNLKNLLCLRSTPDRKEAVLLRYGLGTDRSTLIHVDLGTLETTSQYTLPRTDATRGFHGPQMKISPDFRLLAAVVCCERQAPGTTSIRSTYSLRVLDPETMEVTDLDDEVAVEISWASSHAIGTPPFGWLSAQEILYQHMTPEDANEGEYRAEAEYVLKCVHVGTGETSEWYRPRGVLGLEGNEMWRCWLTGEPKRDSFAVGIETRTLMQCTLSHLAKLDPEGRERWFRERHFDYRRERRTGRGTGLSPSGEHVAFVSRTDTGATTLCAQTKDMSQPVVVAEVPYLASIVAWIEDTSTLRKKRPNCENASSATPNTPS